MHLADHGEEVYLTSCGIAEHERDQQPMGPTKHLQAAHERNSNID